MKDLVPGFIAALLLALFLGFYAVRIGSVALWVIIVSVVVMMIVDFVQAVRSNGDPHTN